MVEDFRGDQAYGQFATGGIPLFVVIYGVAGSSSHDQWGVVYRSAGYPGANALRTRIISIEAVHETPPRIESIRGARVIKVGEAIALEV